MANIKQIKLPNGTIYDIVDAGARELISALGDALYWVGVTTTALTDGATTNPIVVNGENVTAKLGGMAQYSGEEFIWNGSAWQSVGKNNFGDFAFVSSGDVTASGTFTAEGTVSLTTSEVSVVNGITEATKSTIKEFDEAGSVTAGSAAQFTQGEDTFTQGTDTFTATVDENEVLALGFTQGTDSFTQGDDSFTANVPTAVSLPTSKETSVVTDQGTVTSGTIDVPSSATFTGTEDQAISVTGTATPHTVTP